MENLFSGIYKDKKVLITGHTGFKGSWLALWLIKLGAEVIGYSKDIPTSPSHFELLNLDIISIEGDILDKDKVYTTIEKYQPDIIFHLAAQSLVRESYKNPINTFETNIMGTLNILEACRKLGNVKAIVNITSDKCYENKEDGKLYIESDPLGGNDPYSASKGATEIVSQSYRKSFFPIEEYKLKHNTLLANARAGNVIGGGDWAEDRLIPDIIKATVNKKSAVIRNPDAIRPWQHVLEPLHGYLKLGQKLLDGDATFASNWNFGPEETSFKTVNEIVTEVKINWNDIEYKVEKDTLNKKESTILKLNSQKSKKKLGCKNIWNYKITIEKTIEWYKAYYTTKNVQSEKNLEEYIKDLIKHQ